MNRLWIGGGIGLCTLLLASGWLYVRAQGVPFADIQDHRFRDDVMILYNKGVVGGYPDGTFRPESAINRAEFLKILMGSLSSFDYAQDDTISHYCFTDFIGEEQWYWRYACNAKERGIIGGYPDGTFNGEQTVNLVEALKMVVQAYGVPPAGAPPPEGEGREGGVWYAQYWNLAQDNGIFNFLPQNPSHLLTRGEMSALVVRFGGVSSRAESRDGSVSPFDYAQGDTEKPCKKCHSERSRGMSNDMEEQDSPAVFNRRSTVPVRIPNIDLSEPVRHAAMRIEQLTIADRNVSEGAEDTVLLRVRALAGRQDVAITSLIFEAASGSLHTATNYRLFYGDNGGSLIPLPGLGRLQGSRVVFAPVDIPIEDGFEKMFEVHADLVQDPSDALIALRFAVSDPQYVHAVGRIDGRELIGITTDNVRCALTYSICWIEVFTAAPSRITVSAQGNLFVTAGSVPARSRQLLLGEESGPLFTLNFRAEKEDIVVKSLAIDGLSSSIDALDIVMGSLTFRAYRSGCTPVSSTRACVTFPAGSNVVPKDRDVNMEIWGLLKADIAGGISGETALLSVSASTSAANLAVEAWGRGSDRDLNQNDGDSSGDGEIFIGRSIVGANASVTGPVHDTVAARIDDIRNVNPDPDGTAVPLGIYPIGQFSFHASPHDNRQGGLNRVRIRNLTFQVSAVNTTMNQQGFTLLRKDNPSLSVSCIANGTTGTITVTCADLEESVLTPNLSPGQSLTLVLQGEVTAVQVAGGSSSLQVRLYPINDRSLSGAVQWDDEETTVQWVDMEESSIQSTAYRTQ